MGYFTDIPTTKVMCQVALDGLLKETIKAQTTDKEMKLNSTLLLK